LPPALNAKRLATLRTDILKFNETVAAANRTAEDATPRSVSPAEAS